MLDPDRERAVACLRMCRRAGTDAERVIWYELAQCWVLLALAGSKVPDWSLEHSEVAPEAIAKTDEITAPPAGSRILTDRLFNLAKGRDLS